MVRWECPVRSGWTYIVHRSGSRDKTHYLANGGISAPTRQEDSSLCKQTRIHVLFSGCLCCVLSNPQESVFCIKHNPHGSVFCTAANPEQSLLCLTHNPYESVLCTTVNPYRSVICVAVNPYGIIQQSGLHPVSFYSISKAIL